MRDDADLEKKKTMVVVVVVVVVGPCGDNNGQQCVQGNNVKRSEQAEWKDSLFSLAGWHTHTRLPSSTHTHT